MAQVTQQDISGLTAFLIYQNRDGVIASLQKYGYSVDSNINNRDLFNMLSKLSQSDIISYWKVIGDVQIDRSKATDAQLAGIKSLFGGSSATSSGSAVSKSALDYLKDLLPGNTTVTNPNTQTVVSTPGLSAIWIVVLAAIVIGILGFLVYKFKDNKKFTIIGVVLIVVVIILTVIYGATAKASTTTTSGGGATANQSQGIFGALSSINWGSLFGKSNSSTVDQSKPAPDLFTDDPCYDKFLQVWTC